MLFKWPLFGDGKEITLLSKLSKLAANECGVPSKLDLRWAAQGPDWTLFFTKAPVSPELKEESDDSL
jgi:hypothetical protein